MCIFIMVSYASMQQVRFSVHPPPSTHPLRYIAVIRYSSILHVCTPVLSSYPCSSINSQVGPTVTSLENPMDSIVIIAQTNFNLNPFEEFTFQAGKQALTNNGEQ